MAAPAPTFRKDLSLPALLQALRNHFDTDPPPSRAQFSDSDVLLSGLAVFLLKYPSLLAFDTDAHGEEDVVRSNLRSLYGVDLAPSDSQLRERLDRIDPDVIRSAMQSVWPALQRAKALEPFRFLGNHLLLSFDGTGQFASSKISCPQCCVKQTRDGEQFYHQLFAGVLVHPDVKHVLPIEAEPITRLDGATKNDCERNAAKRAMTRLRERFPKHNFIVVEDALGSNGPHLQLLQSLGLSFIIGVKFTDHTALAEAMQARQIIGQCTEAERALSGGGVQGFRYYRDLPLNATHPDLRVNVLEYWEVDAKGKERYFSWVTDIELNETNAWEVARGGRARWKIENETFNTLKNQGYHLEHNFGHGRQHLSTNFALLCLTAFLVDQVQAHSCRVFQAVREKMGSTSRLWRKLRSWIDTSELPSWEVVYGLLLGTTKARQVYDSS